jgi:DNA-binding transcriptional ArsR family regulator
MEDRVVHLCRNELEAETASLWRALADPTRRRILDLLSDRPRITGEIASHFAISRIAVMRHLEVLGAAELITSRKRGRERWHYMNAVPLQRLQERWAGPVAGGFASGLLRLQDRVETEGRRTEVDRPVIDVALDVTIAGSRGAVFSALTEDIGGWWGDPALDPRAVGLSLDPTLGGQFVEHWELGGQLVATVSGFSPERHLALTGSFHLALGIGVATFDLDEVPGGTLLRFTFRAVGVVEPAMVEGMSRGWKELIGTRLKALVETGTRMGIDVSEPAEVGWIRDQESRSSRGQKRRNAPDR